MNIKHTHTYIYQSIDLNISDIVSCSFWYHSHDFSMEITLMGHSPWKNCDLIEFNGIEQGYVL
jgi:hypothetical protein